MLAPAHCLALAVFSLRDLAGSIQLFSGCRNGRFSSDKNQTAEQRWALPLTEDDEQPVFQEWDEREVEEASAAKLYSSMKK
jgi:hypothetical protein